MTVPSETRARKTGVSCLTEMSVAALIISALALSLVLWLCIWAVL